jgi:hypothetical protein
VARWVENRIVCSEGWIPEDEYGMSKNGHYFKTIKKNYLKNF